MTTRSTRATAALLMGLLAGVGALAGCASQQAPAAPMPTTTSDTKAQDFAAAEQVVRNASADFAEHGRYTDERWLYPQVIADQSEFLEQMKIQGLTRKGTVEVLSVEPLGYNPESYSLAVHTCAKVTGGLYDKNGKNVTVDPAGTPVDDKKPRRIKERVRLGKVQGAPSWRIKSFEILADPC